MAANVKLDDLEMAMEWLAAAETAGSQADAFVSRDTGHVYWRGEGVEEQELPADLEDEHKYVPVPSRHEFDLGKPLVMRFVRERLPDAYDHVREIFARRGAYGRYKDFLDSAGMLDAWHAYADDASKQALRAWCVENGLAVEGQEQEQQQEAQDAAPAALQLEGGCDCRYVRYRMQAPPLVVHCCHCRWCQRESGASFALNALVESERVELLSGEVDLVDTPSESGRGQQIARCPRCRIAVWSHYAGLGAALKFVRVGTLDDPDALPPDIHIFTASRQPWVVLPPGTPAVPEYYDRRQVWRPESLERLERLQALRARPALSPQEDR